MARHPRIFVRDYPHHVVQRGHDSSAVFVESADYEYYLANLLEWKTHFDIDVYAYCLMTNHVHLVLAPRTEGTGISGLMRRLSARQARYVNRRERRSGTLWGGRFKSSVVDSENYLLACMRYVDLNPVRAGICLHPADYLWSSYAQKAGLRTEEWLDLDPVTARLGDGQAARRRAYIAFVEAEIPDDEHNMIRTAVRRNQLTGDGCFVDEIEHRTGLRIEARTPGRPSEK